MSKIKRAILVAAGEGSRLRPVTLETPKPLVKVNGKCIMDTSIEALRANGIQDIYIVVGYKKETFYEAYIFNRPQVHICALSGLNKNSDLCDFTVVFHGFSSLSTSWSTQVRL